MKAVKPRNEQFETIQRLKDAYEADGNPMVSMDTKKKEYLGTFYRDGHLYTLEELRAYDHDFPSFAEGVIIPHSLYDLRLMARRPIKAEPWRSSPIFVPTTWCGVIWAI